jgi:hypothetical protein
VNRAAPVLGKERLDEEEGKYAREEKEEDEGTKGCFLAYWVVNGLELLW